jgi:hypothetical protein
MSTDVGRDRWAKRLFRRADGIEESSSPSPSGKTWPTALSHHVILIGQFCPTIRCASAYRLVSPGLAMGLRVYDHVQAEKLSSNPGL